MAPNHAIAGAATALVETSLGDTVPQSGSRHRRDRGSVSGRLPIKGLQIVQQRNLLFQLGDAWQIMDFFASISRVRQNALRCQARMVGVGNKCWPLAPAWIQHQAEQSPLCPSAQGRWIGQLPRVFAVRYGLLDGIAAADPLTGLLPTVQAIVRGRR
jgi:hypothetical protein